MKYIKHPSACTLQLQNQMILIDLNRDWNIGLSAEFPLVPLLKQRRGQLPQPPQTMFITTPTPKCYPQCVCLKHHGKQHKKSHNLQKCCYYCKIIHNVQYTHDHTVSSHYHTLISSALVLVEFIPFSCTCQQCSCSWGRYGSHPSHHQSTEESGSNH